MHVWMSSTTSLLVRDQSNVTSCLEVWRGTGRWMMGVPELATNREAEERNGPVAATTAKTATSFSILEIVRR